MADKQDEGSNDVDESSRLRGDLVALVSQRLGTLCKGYGEEALAKVLNKRRKKWRKRHKLQQPNYDYQPLDPALQEEREGRLNRLIEVKTVLTQWRKESFNTARQLQRDCNTQCLHVLARRLDAAWQSVQMYEESQSDTALAQTTLPSTSSSSNNLGESVVQDLEDTLSQAVALSNIRKMKHHMTPRVPVLHCTHLEDFSPLLTSRETVPPVLGETVEVSTTIILDHRQTGEGEGGSGPLFKAAENTAYLSPVIANLQLVSVQTSEVNVEDSDFPLSSPKHKTEPAKESTRSTPKRKTPLKAHALPVDPDETPNRSIPEHEAEPEGFCSPSTPKTPRLDVELNGTSRRDPLSQEPYSQDKAPSTDSSGATATAERKVQRITKQSRRGQQKGRISSRRIEHTDTLGQQNRRRSSRRIEHPHRLSYHHSTD